MRIYFVNPETNGGGHADVSPASRIPSLKKKLESVGYKVVGKEEYHKARKKREQYERKMMEET